MKSNIHHGFEKLKSYYYIWYSEIMQRDVISLTVDPFYRLIILIYCWYNFFLQQEMQHLIVKNTSASAHYDSLLPLKLDTGGAVMVWCWKFVRFTVFNISTAIWLVGILAFNGFFLYLQTFNVTHQDWASCELNMFHSTPHFVCCIVMKINSFKFHLI